MAGKPKLVAAGHWKTIAEMAVAREAQKMVYHILK
jgi:hypothetical protein